MFSIGEDGVIFVYRVSSVPNSNLVVGKLTRKNLALLEELERRTKNRERALNNEVSHAKVAN